MSRKKVKWGQKTEGEEYILAAESTSQKAGEKWKVFWRDFPKEKRKSSDIRAGYPWLLCGETQMGKKTRLLNQQEDEKMTGPLFPKLLSVRKLSSG